jgi:hypothetical protein
MRPASATDFSLPVEGVGTFVFAQRKMADHLRIHVEYSKITEGVMPTPWLDTFATCIATMRVLMVRAPEGFDLDELDPLDPKSEEKILLVRAALKEKEDSFRGGPKQAGQGGGTPEV